jgi:thiaminase
MAHVKLDYSKIEIAEIDGVDHSDYPDYCDAYISKAYIEGQEATEKQLDEMNNNDEFRYNSVIENLH